MWGLGVLGMDRKEFYTSSLGELQNRIKGFITRELEIKNIGNRRIYSAIVNALLSFGKDKNKTEHELWPMDIDEEAPKKEIPKSEDLFSKYKDKIAKFWPEVNG